jgi:hypothetical protein
MVAVLQVIFRCWPPRVGLEPVSKGEEPAAGKPPRSDANLYLTVAAPIFFALFFLEYLPLFALGYWSWSGTLHKILSGGFLILNLAIAEYSVRRSRSKDRRGMAKAAR